MRRWEQSAILGILTAVCGAVFALMPTSTTLEESTGLWWLFTVRGAIQPPPGVVAPKQAATPKQALKAQCSNT